MINDLKKGNTMTTLRTKMIEDMQLRRFSVNTQRSYLQAVTGLARHFRRSPDKISRDEYRDYILFLTNERKLSYSTIRTATAGISFFYKEILHRKDMALAIPKRKKSRRLPEVFSRSELVRLFGSVKNEKHRAMLMTAYGCGLRVSEVIALKVADIDSKRMMVKIYQSKGAKDRYTILPPILLAELRSYWLKYRPPYWLFTSNQTRGKLSRKTAHKIFIEAKDRAGIKKNVTFHGFRHSFATHMLEEGVDIRTIQILMGHASISSTMTYLHIARKDIGPAKSPLDLLYAGVR